MARSQSSYSSRVAHDISSYDTSRYSLHLATSSSTQTPRYHVGQPIRLSWTAPSNHSRKDWIGIYRLGSCKSQLVTRLSSVGKWMPIYEEEYDGDTQISPPATEQTEKKDAGTVVFKGNQLPWAPGKYEVRYHHDGKHNVMSRVAPVDIYGELNGAPCAVLGGQKLIKQSTNRRMTRIAQSGRPSSISLPSRSTQTLSSCPTVPSAGYRLSVGRTQEAQFRGRDWASSPQASSRPVRSSRMGSTLPTAG